MDLAMLRFLSLLSLGVHSQAHRAIPESAQFMYSRSTRKEIRRLQPTEDSAENLLSIFTYRVTNSRKSIHPSTKPSLPNSISATGFPHDKRNPNPPSHPVGWVESLVTEPIARRKGTE